MTGRFLEEDFVPPKFLSGTAKHALNLLFRFPEDITDPGWKALRSTGAHSVASQKASSASKELLILGWIQASAHFSFQNLTRTCNFSERPILFLSGPKEKTLL